VNGTNGDDIDIDTVISEVLNNSFIGDARITYLLSNFSWSINEQEIDVAAASFSKPSSDSNGIGILLKLTLADPEPMLSNWQTVLRVNMLALSSNNTYLVKYLKTKVSRTFDQDLATYGFLNYNDDWSNFDENEALELFFIEYSEKVTQKYRSTKAVYTMESQLRQSIWTTAEDALGRTGFQVQKGDLILIYKPDLSVDHWTEYVAFGYWDWLTGIGGMFSIMSTVFFLFAYYLSKIFATDGSVGILPEMSFVFANFEEIRGIQSTK